MGEPLVQQRQRCVQEINAPTRLRYVFCGLGPRWRHDGATVASRWRHGGVTVASVNSHIFERTENSY